MKKRPSTELPQDVKDKLRELEGRSLQEFLKQQKKVIEATENLAKKPVEDFTEKEKQLLKDLAAAEDDWSRFLADQHSDLSKLPEQDFANPSLLKELLEVQTELKMAKDALTKKTADIAVPLEQLGAEMAKEMTTNIEKWLPDTPDRERWSQEEPLTDDDEGSPDGRAAQGAGRPRRQADGGGGRPVRRDGGRFQQLGRLDRQGGRLGRRWTGRFRTTAPRG